MNQVNFDVTKAYELLTEKLENWLSAAIKMLPNFVVAILVLVAFVVAAKFIRKLAHRLFKRVTDNISLQNLLSTIIYMIVVAIGTFVALSIIQLDGAVTSLLAGAGVIGLALGFAFQEIASNFIAGTMMSVRKPFDVGDLIKTNDYLGIVQQIQLRTTELKTLTGQIVLIPNAEVFKSPIENYSDSGRRRVDLSVGVTYDTDLEFALNTALDAIKSLDGIDKDAVDGYYTEFGDSSINFTVRYWMPFNNKQYEYFSRLSAGVIAIKKAFDKNDITIPFPIRTLDFADTDFKGIFKEASTSFAKNSSTGSGSASADA